MQKPKPGDIWEFQIPGKRKKVKEIDSIRERRLVIPGKAPETALTPFVSWKRRPKGRYTGVRLSLLMKVGKLISTKKQRDAALEERFKRIGKQLFDK